MGTNVYAKHSGVAGIANCPHIVTAHPAAKQASVMTQMMGMFVCARRDGKDATAQKRSRRVRVRLACTVEDVLLLTIVITAVVGGHGRVQNARIKL